MLLDLKAGRIDAAIWWGYTYDYAAQQNPTTTSRSSNTCAPEFLGSETLPATYYVFKKEGTESLIAGLRRRDQAAAGQRRGQGDPRQVWHDQPGLLYRQALT